MLLYFCETEICLGKFTWDFGSDSVVIDWYQNQVYWLTGTRIKYWLTGARVKWLTGTGIRYWLTGARVKCMTDWYQDQVYWLTGARIKCTDWLVPGSSVLTDWCQGHHIGLFNDELVETNRRVTVPNKAYCWLTAFMKSRKVCRTAQGVCHITCWNRRVAWAILHMEVEEDSCQKIFWSCQWMWLFRWPNQVRMRSAGYVACMGPRCVCWIFMGKAEGKSQHVIRRGRSAGTIKWVSINGTGGHVLH
jgi:hypothetical protein